MWKVSCLYEKMHDFGVVPLSIYMHIKLKSHLSVHLSVASCNLSGFCAKQNAHHLRVKLLLNETFNCCICSLQCDECKGVEQKLTWILFVNRK